MQTVLNRLVPSTLALAISAVAVPMTAQAAGFIEDSKASLNLRNYYFNRDYINHTDPADNRAHGKAEGWTQSFILDARSGFSEGRVGFGLDVLAMASYKLDGNRGVANTQLLPMDSNKEALTSFGRVAVAAKAKVSNTELKIGEWVVVNPMLRADDGRSLPQTFKGGQVTSNEIDGLTLIGARFNGNSQRHDTSMERMSFNNVKSSALNLTGAEYRFNDNATLVGAWHSRLEDVYKQSYLQVLHTQPVGDWVLSANLGYFNGSEEGSADAGKLNNEIYQGSFTARTGAHAFTVAHQQVRGDTKFLRIDGASGGSLVNDGFTNSYDAPNESSWQLRHDYNFAALGVPGLTMMNRYVSGKNIDVYTNGVKTREDAEEWGRESELAYTIQSGTFKNMSVRWRNSTVRRDAGQDHNENRLIVNFPINLL